MSGFGGFGTGTTGGGGFGANPSEQGATGFTAPATSNPPTTTFGTPTFGSGGTGLFGSTQQNLTFGSGFGSRPSAGVTTVTTATGFTFGIPTTTTSTSAFGTLGTTNFSNLGQPKTTAPTGFTLPSTTTTALAGATPFNFGLTPTTTTAPAATAAPLSFGLPSTTTAASATPLSFGLPTTTTTAATAPLSFRLPGTTTTATTAPTWSLNVTTAGTLPATTAQRTIGFTLPQPTTTAPSNFPAAKTFGITTTAPTFEPGLFGVPKTTGTTTITTSIATTPLVGLGGVDNTQTTQGLSGSGTLEPKQAKDHTLPDQILQTLNDFQNFTKQQKSISVEISQGSSKPLKKVQEDTEAMESLLTMITSGLTRNAIAVDKLKTETAQGLHQAEMAQRNHETPPGLEYDNTAPSDYFHDLVTKFETDTVRLRVQIEASEKHLRSLTQSSTISPQELTLAMRRLHETLIVLAARVQALHTSVQSQKEQYKNLRRVYFKDDSNIFENETNHNLVKKQTIYSQRSLTGPTPFSETPGTGPPLNIDGLAMLANYTGASIPTTTTNPCWMSPLQGTTNAASILPTSNLLSTPQPVEVPGFQLSKPPTGNKRNKR